MGAYAMDADLCITTLWYSSGIETGHNRPIGSGEAARAPQTSGDPVLAFFISLERSAENKFPCYECIDCTAARPTVTVSNRLYVIKPQLSGNGIPPVRSVEHEIALAASAYRWEVDLARAAVDRSLTGKFVFIKSQVLHCRQSLQ